MILLIIISWNIIANYYFLRIDLTEEKRYTLSNATKKVLKTLDDQVYVEVFLDGDLPPGFKRLQKSIKEFLDETRIFARSNVQYTFLDPMASNDEGAQQKFFSKLAQRGLQPTNIFAKENGKQTEKLIFPGAIVSYKGREIPINLLKSAAGVPPAEALNQSEEGIEFEIVSAINKLSSKTSKSIGFVQGHGELSELETKDIFDNLSESYNVERINVLNSNQLNENYHVLIIAKPTQYFSENEKIKLDQFVINGGNLILFIDKTNASLDQLEDGKTTAIALESNLEDLFFKFGFRLNPTLYQDAQCGMLPMVVGMQGNQPQTQLMPWMFYPVCTHFSNHPMVKNMSGVSTKFIGSIDTVKAVGITKTPIMFTSKYCKEIAVPCEINLMEARKQPNPAEFTKGQQPVAYLLEGKFKSLFTNRLTQSMEDSIDFQSQKNEAKIIVFADGDIIKNEVLAKSNETLPLGFDRYLQKKLANKDLILNCIDYVCGGKDLITLRAKELKLRPLDKNNIENKRTKWQIINVALPLVLLIIFCILKYQWRLKKYSV
ncbi:MAG: gliding motility-associated ABC transporter substrate-binding protein GldG [Cytophagales bacterium]|nr:MAG: gliding motility-associated ABC transporter substrate-binding protein GldG [Cytophagales bacterium]